MTDEEYGPTVLGDLAHPAETLLLEGEIPHGKDLVDDEDVGLEVRRDGESQPDVHPARVPLDRLVEVLLDAGELDDLVEAPVDLAAAHPKERAVQVHVLTPRQLGAEPGPDLEQRADSSRHVDEAGGRLSEPR